MTRGCVVKAVSRNFFPCSDTDCSFPKPFDENFDRSSCHGDKVLPKFPSWKEPPTTVPPTTPLFTSVSPDAGSISSNHGTKIYPSVTKPIAISDPVSKVWIWILFLVIILIVLAIVIYLSRRNRRFQKHCNCSQDAESRSCCYFFTRVSSCCMECCCCCRLWRRRKKHKEEIQQGQPTEESHPMTSNNSHSPRRQPTEKRELINGEKPGDDTVGKQGQENNNSQGEGGKKVQEAVNPSDHGISPELLSQVSHVSQIQLFTPED